MYKINSWHRAHRVQTTQQRPTRWSLPAGPFSILPHVVTTYDAAGAILAKYEFENRAAACDFAAHYDLTVGNMRPGEVASITIEPIERN